MFTHRFLNWTAPLVAAAVLAFTPALGTAKPRGGGGHSGGHAVHAVNHRAPAHSSGRRATAHYGALNARVYRGGAHYARAYRGGAVHAYRGGRYYPNRGYYGRRYYGGGYYGGYGWNPWLGDGLGYSDAYDYSPDVNNTYDVAPNNDYVAPDTANHVPDQSFFAAPAELNVILPADGTVSFGDFQAAQAGGAHLYETPALNAGSPYSYTIQARWMNDGQPVTRTKTVQFHAGETINVDFNAP